MFLGVGVGAFSAGHLPCDDACVLQGAALPVRRLRDSFARRRAGHEQDGRAAQASADHLRDDADCDAMRSRRFRRSRDFSPRTTSSTPPTTRAITWLWLLGIITAAMTSFYMFRLIFMTFHGDSRVDAEKAHHIHESPPVMTIPLMVLALLAIIGGWVGLPEGFLWGDKISEFPRRPRSATTPRSCTAAFVMLTERLARAGGPRHPAGVVLLHQGAGHAVSRSRTRRSPPYELLLNKYYVDEFLQHDRDRARCSGSPLSCLARDRFVHDRRHRSMARA